jgi:Arc/MetJ-type ribon-helix-helix transcriptional regulator
MQGRTKISVSLPRDLVDLIDRGVRAHRFPSRSAAIEEALRRAERSQRDAAIEEYYGGRTDEERREERAWGELGAEALAISSRAAERPVRYRGSSRKKR